MGLDDGDVITLRDKTFGEVGAIVTGTHDHNTHSVSLPLVGQAQSSDIDRRFRGKLSKISGLDSSNRPILEAVSNKIGNPILIFHDSINDHPNGFAGNFIVGFPHLWQYHHIDQPGLILEIQEAHSPCRARTLPMSDQSPDLHPLPMDMESKHIGSPNATDTIQLGTQKLHRMCWRYRGRPKLSLHDLRR